MQKISAQYLIAAALLVIIAHAAIAAASTQDTCANCSQSLSEKEILESMGSDISQMKEAGFSTRKTELKFRDAKNALAQDDIERARSIAEEIRAVSEDAFVARKLLNTLRQRSTGSTDMATGNIVLQDATHRAAELLLEEAAIAMEKEEYTAARSLIQQAERLMADDMSRSDFSAYVQQNSSWLLSFLFATVFLWLMVRFIKKHRLADARQPPTNTKTAILLITLTFLAAVPLAYLVVWFGNSLIMANALSQLTLVTSAKAASLEVENKRIETAVTDIGGIVLAKFNDSAGKQDAAYFTQYIDEVDPYMRAASETTQGTAGSFLYFNADRYNGVHYLWYNLENKSLQRRADLEEDIPGYLRMSSETYRENYDYIWYYGAVTTGLPLWTEVYLDTDLQQNCISYVRPLYMNGSIIGVIGMDISISRIERILQDTSTYDGNDVFLIDRNGRYITASTHVLKNETNADLKKSESGIIDQGDKVIGYQRLSNGQTVAIAVEKNELLANFSGLRRVIILSTAFLLCIIILAVVIISNKLMKNMDAE